MKKLLLVLAAMGMVSFLSCEENAGNSEGSENSNENEENDSSESLAGTRWVAVAALYGVNHEKRSPINEEEEKYELIFTSDDEVTLHLTNKYPDREEDLTVSGTYEYDRPEIVFFGLQIDTKHELSQLGMLNGEDGPPSTVTGEDTMIVQMFLGGDILQLIEFRKQEPQS